MKGLKTTGMIALPEALIQRPLHYIMKVMFLYPFETKNEATFALKKQMDISLEN